MAGRNWIQRRDSKTPEAHVKRMLRFAAQHEKAAARKGCPDPKLELEYARQYRANAVECNRAR